MRRSTAPSLRKFVSLPDGSTEYVPRFNAPFVPHASRDTASILELVLDPAPEACFVDTKLTWDTPASARRDVSGTGRKDTPTSACQDVSGTGRKDTPTSACQDVSGTGRKDTPTSACQDVSGTSRKDTPTSVFPDSSSITSVPDNLCTSTRVFTVLWGKQTKKKHKTWEGDGTLEVTDCSAVLKDVGGQVLGRAGRVRLELLEEGGQLNVGSKEVQIVEVMYTNENKRPASETVIATPQRVPKRPRRTSLLSAKHEELKMPPPSHQHQWHHNPGHLPVTEVSVDPCLTRVLRPHQRTGLVFLYECVVGMKLEGHFGAILADEMGLGKTLQCVALVWTLLKQGPYGSRAVLNRVLVVTPSSLVANWSKEFQRWLGRERLTTFVVDQKSKPKEFANLPHVRVMLISYEMFVRYHGDVRDIQFDLLICDEGHRLKNTNIRAATLLSQLPCERRVLLTGTPIQNDLQEFYSLINFVNPGILGSSAEFRQEFEEPIVRSRQPDAEPEVRAIGEERASELNRKTGWFILRRTQQAIDQYLPSKHEAVVFCAITPLQVMLYKAAVQFWDNKNAANGLAHLGVITALKKICNHPTLLSRATSDCQPDEESLVATLAQLIPADVATNLTRHSGKLSVVVHLLQELHTTKERIVLVSYYTQTLDLLAAICDGSGYSYCRLDGSTPTAQRLPLIDTFNSPHSNYFVFLLSARAGGMGLNLTGASRLVLYDCDWNPASDLQAVSRIWRDGQSHSVHIYRLLTAGTIEEKIFQRQISKTGLSEAVVDPSNINVNKMADHELKDLFTLHEHCPCQTHQLLRCGCSSRGEVPDYLEDGSTVSDIRPCQLNSAPHQGQGQMPRVNQLLQWEHHAPPFRQCVLQTMCLSSAVPYITFMFRNSSALTKTGDNSQV